MKTKTTKPKGSLSALRAIALINWLFIIIGLIFFSWLLMPTPTKPSHQIAKEYFNEHPEAESVNIFLLKNMRETFELFKTYSRKDLDIRSEAKMNYYKNDSDYEKMKFVCRAELINDSIVIIDDYDPITTKLAIANDVTPTYESKFIFHKNSDIEIIHGNLLFSKQDAKINARLKVDGLCGGITSFSKNEEDQHNFFRLTVAGKLCTGVGYQPQLASAMFQLGYNRFAYLQKKLNNRPPVH